MEQARKANVEEIKRNKSEIATKRADARSVEEMRKRGEARKEEERAALEKKRDANIKAREEQRRKDSIANEKKGKASSNQGSKYSKHDVLLLKKIFDDYDLDGNGSISIKELREALKGERRKQPAGGAKRKGSITLADLAEPLFYELDNNGDGSINFSELLKVMFPLANDRDKQTMLSWVAGPKPKIAPTKTELTSEQRGEIRAIFNLYDKGNNGELTIKELTQALETCGMTRKEIDELFEQYDEDQNGVITFDEFVRMMAESGLY